MDNEENKIKIRDSHGRFLKDRIVPVEIREKLSKRMKGKPSPLAGKKHTKEAKEKMRLAKLGKRGIGMTGKKHSEETKKKLSQRFKGKHFSPRTELKKGARIGKIFVKKDPRITGEANSRWKGGKTPENIKERGSPEALGWRKTIFSRDDFSCQVCGDRRGGNLQAHHFENFSENKDLRYEEENGITLCCSCHMAFHRAFGFSHNNKQQFISFLEENFNGNFIRSSQ